MPSYTIYSAASDGIASYYSTTSWADMRSSATANYSSDTIAAEANGLYVVGANWIDYVHNHSFDTSAVVGTLSSANLSLSCYNGPARTFEARVNSWASGTSWVNGANWGSLTLSGSASFPSGASRTSIPLSTSTVAISSAFKLTVADPARSSASAPSDADYRKIFYFAEEAGTTNDPYLSITTTTVTRRAPRTSNWLV